MPYSINVFRPVSIQVQLNPELTVPGIFYYQVQSGHDLICINACSLSLWLTRHLGAIQFRSTVRFFGTYFRIYVSRYNSTIF